MIKTVLTRDYLESKEFRDLIIRILHEVQNERKNSTGTGEIIECQ